MAYAAAALAIAGAAASGASSVQEKDVQAKALDRSAESTLDAAKLEEAQQRRKSHIMMGKANALGAASGLSLSSGSPLLMELDRAKQSEIDALSIRRTGEMGAANKRFESRMVRRSIPFSIFGTGGQTGSILSQYMASK